MSVLSSIIRRVILEAPGQQPTPADLALAYYSMSIAPSSVVKQILSNNAPILMYVRVFTDSAGNPIRSGSLNKIAMQMGVPTPTPDLMQKIRKALGSFEDLKQKVKSAREERGRPTRLVRSIVDADIDERFFPRELLFSVMQKASLVQAPTSTNVLPQELRAVITSMRVTLKEIEQTYKSSSVAEAVSDVQEELDGLVAQFRRSKSRQLGSHVSQDFGFADTQEQEYASELSLDDDPLTSIEDIGPKDRRRASSELSSPAAWRRPRSLAEAILGNDDEDDPYAFDIGDASTFDSPVDALAGNTAQQPSAELSGPAPSIGEPDDDEDQVDLVRSLLDSLGELQEHDDVDTDDLAETVHVLIDAMNEEKGAGESIDASSVTP